MLAPKSLSSPQNAAITAGGTPYSFSARANAAACVWIRACALLHAASAPMRRGELGEDLAEHALAAVAVDDALVVDEVGRRLRQRALRHALGGRPLLEVGEEAIERCRCGRPRRARGALRGRRPVAAAGRRFGRRGRGRAGRPAGGAGWADAEDERTRDAAAAGEHLLKSAPCPPRSRIVRVEQSEARRPFAALPGFNRDRWTCFAQPSPTPPQSNLPRKPRRRIGACRIEPDLAGCSNRFAPCRLAALQGRIRPSPIWGGQKKGDRGPP